jgi:hypothetical protein
MASLSSPIGSTIDVVARTVSSSAISGGAVEVVVFLVAVEVEEEVVLLRYNLRQV